MPPAAHRAGIADVAALAGVSQGTASKALNGVGSLRPATRDRVRAAAEELGFSPSPLARSLATGRSFTVGVMTTDSYGRFSIPVMRGAEDALGVGTAAFLCDSREDRIREQHYLRTLLTRRVDGIIVAGRCSQPRPPIGRDLPVPVVYALGPSNDPQDCSVASDEPGGTRSAVEHLLETGRRRIAHVTGPRTHGAAAVRANSAVEALRAHGRELAGEVWFGAWTEAWGRAAGRALIRAAADIDAVLCGSDTIARGVVETLLEAGRRVPEDVAVVGVDNWDRVVDACHPHLTSVDLELEAVGRKAGDLLLKAIDGVQSPGLHLVPCRLVARGSSVLR